MIAMAVALLATTDAYLDQSHAQWEQVSRQLDPGGPTPHVVEITILLSGGVGLYVQTNTRR